MKDGGPAFPTMTPWEPGRKDGMSLRDYFAAAALQGLMTTVKSETVPVLTGEFYSVICYRLADAMLAERDK